MISGWDCVGNTDDTQTSQMNRRSTCSFSIYQHLTVNIVLLWSFPCLPEIPSRLCVDSAVNSRISRRRAKQFSNHKTTSLQRKTSTNRIRIPHTEFPFARKTNSYSYSMAELLFTFITNIHNCAIVIVIVCLNFEHIVLSRYKLCRLLWPKIIHISDVQIQLTERSAHDSDIEIIPFGAAAAVAVACSICEHTCRTNLCHSHSERNAFDGLGEHRIHCKMHNGKWNEESVAQPVTSAPKSRNNWHRNTEAYAENKKKD